MAYHRSCSRADLQQLSTVLCFSFCANDDDYDRHRTTTLHCNIAASAQYFLFHALLLDLSYIHTNKHILTTNDHGHNWEYTCIMQAHLHLRSYARLSTAGSFKRHSANSLRTEHQCDCSARKLALGRTYTGRSFLEEEQHHRVSTESKRLTHCAYFQQKPDLWRQLSESSLLDSEASKTQQLRTGTLSRLKIMTLNVLTLRWMKYVDFLF